MHRIFQTFIDRLCESADATALRASMADAATALDLNCFAYLSVPSRSNAEPLLIVFAARRARLQYESTMLQ